METDRGPCAAQEDGSAAAALCRTSAPWADPQLEETLATTSSSSGASGSFHEVRRGGELFPGLSGFSSCYPGGRVVVVTTHNPFCWAKATANTTPLLHNTKIEAHYFSFVCTLPTQSRITLRRNKRNPGVYLAPAGSDALLLFLLLN